MNVSTRLAAFLAALMFCTVPAVSPASAQFYKGKTLTVLVNYPAGGAADLEGRLWARHLKKYIAGSPRIMVRNMGGAGGLVATNFLGEVAKPDGLTVSFFTWNPLAQLLGDPALRVKYNDFVTVAGVAPPVVVYSRKDVAPGINNAYDFVNAHDFKFGGLRATSLHDVRSRLALDLLLTPKVYTVVTGFRGFSSIYRAIQQGEAQVSAASIPGYRGTVVPTMIETGIAVPVFHFGIVTADGNVEASPDVPDIPTMSDLYNRKYEKPPEGIKWESLKYLNQLAGHLFRTVFLPPGSPTAARDALVDAYRMVVADKDFLADYKKVIKAPPRATFGNEAQNVISKLGSTDPKIIQFLREYVKSGIK